MTNTQTDPEVELEEGEIEDDCEFETQTDLGISESNKIESSTIDTKSEEDGVKDKDKSSNSIKSSKRSSRSKEKVSEYKKYTSETKAMDWRDMLYDDLDKGEDDNIDDAYHRELEEVRKRLTGDFYGRSNSETPSGDEDDRIEERKLRNLKRFDEVDESSKFQARHSDKKAKITCKFFLDGNCMKGADCLYSHDKSRIRERDICKSFKAMGSCPFGMKCRFIHFDISQKAKKEPLSRKRRSSSDKDESEQPPRKKIPSLLDLDVVPRGQSEEDVGKALMIAAKRSVTHIQKSKTRKIGLLGTPPAKKSSEKRKFIKEVVSEIEDDHMSEDDIEDNMHDKEDFGDKDERQIKHYNDIDERQNLNQAHMVENDNSNNVEEETSKIQPPINNGINVRALLGDAPAPLNNAPMRAPLLGNAPTNFNVPFPQFPRPAMRPSPPPMAITQTLGLIMNQNMSLMSHPQTRMLNSGLLPHPINPSRGPNGGFNPRPYGPGMTTGLSIINNGMPPTYMGPQNIGCNPNQMSNNSNLLPLNMSRDISFLNSNSSLSMPGQFIPEEMKMHQNDVVSHMGVINEQRPMRGLESSQHLPNNPFDQKPPQFDFSKFPPIDQNMNPMKQNDLQMSVNSRNKEDFDSFQGGFGNPGYQDRDMRFNGTQFFDPPKTSGQPYGLRPDEANSISSFAQSDYNSRLELNKIPPLVCNNSTQNDIPAPVVAPITQPDIPESTSFIVTSDTETQPSNSSSTTHEPSSISLSVANEVSFDCKLKGPYSLKKIDCDDRRILPEFVNPNDPKWQGDPRLTTYKLPEISSNNKITPSPVVPSHNPAINTGTSIVQTRDPRLLKRNRKDLEKPPQPLTQPIAPEVTEHDSVKPLEPLEAFLRRYSNLPLSELNKSETPLSTDSKSSDKSDQEATTASHSENANTLTTKKSYQNRIVKKSSTGKPLTQGKSGNNSDALDEEVDDQNKSKRAKTCLEFQSPLVSPGYSTSTMQYGLPPGIRNRDSQNLSDPYSTSQAERSLPVPESSPFAPTPNLDISEGGCVKSLFNNIDPTASPFL